MADRTITARLRVAYENSGLKKMSTDLRGVASEGKKTSQAVGRDWSELSRKTAAIGSSMTTKLTLPLVGLGGAAAKMSTDFSAQFDTMVALAGVASSEIAGLKASVLALSEETGRGPSELADALLQIRGAGLTGKAALDTLEVSAKAAASGLGSTVEVANAVTNVLNGYGAANISAAEAGDILTAAVTSAKVEASEMAPQFGRLIPVAAELGVGFDDVAGALAFLTVSSGDAAQASTGLSGVLTKLLNPSQQGQEALRNIGLEAADLRTMLGQKGLDGTVIELRKRLGDVGFRKLLDDSEALKAGLQMTGASAEQFKDIMGDVGDSTGALDRAFRDTDNEARKAQVTWAKAQVSLIKLGDAIMPIVTILMDLASAAVGFLGHMPDELRTAIVLFGSLLAVSGPVLQMFGSVTTKLAEFSKWLETSSLATGRFGSQLEKVPALAKGAAMALGAIGVALAAIEVIAGQRESRTRGWVEDMIGDPGNLAEVRASIADVKKELDDLDDEEGKHRMFSVGSVDIFATGGDADRDEKIEQLRERLAELQAQEESLVGQEAQTAAAFVGTSEAVAGMTEETSNAVAMVQEYIDAQTALLDPLFGMIDALDGNRAAQAEVTSAFDAMNVAIRDHGEGSNEAREATEAYNEALINAGRSALDVESATAQLEAGIAAGTISVGDAQAAIDGWVEKGLYPAGAAADSLKARVAGAAGQVERISGTHNVDINMRTSGWGAAMDRLRQIGLRIQQLDGSTINVNVNARATSTGRIGGVPVFHEGGVVPGRRGEEVAAILQAGERVIALDDPINRMLSMGPVTSGASYATSGGGDVYIDMRGAIVANDRQFKRMVTDAFNQEARKGRALGATVKVLAR